MRKTFIRISVILAAALVMCLCAFAQGEAEDKNISIMVIGNSITSHGPAAHLDWNNNWGMAATSGDKDYFSVMKKMFNEEFPDWNATWTRGGIYALETAIGPNADMDFTPFLKSAFGNTMAKVVPDVVTFQFGDNCQSFSKKSYIAACRAIVDYCRSINPNMVIVLSEPFYASYSDAKSSSVRTVAEEKGCLSVSLWDLNTAENLGSADNFYTSELNKAILSHPGDKGMEEIAKKFYPAVRYTALALENNAKKGESRDISIWVKDKYIEMDVAPTVVDGRTMVPVRAIFEALGASVDWNQETKTATSTLGDITVSITLNSDTMKKNDEDVKLDVAATIIDGRTLVPVRAISEAFGCSVNWLAATREVQIWQ